MPIVQGNCVPAACVKVAFNAAKASMKTLHNGAPAAMPPAIIALVDGTAADIYNDFLKTLKNTILLECDTDCNCKMAAQNPPWQVAPDHLLYDDKKGWQVYVTGVEVQWHLGWCVPKPKPVAKNN